jgi:hypothetical protein
MTASAAQERLSSLDILAQRGHFPDREQPNKPKDAFLFRCPFHADTNPSFSIHADCNQWICLAGCGKGGPRELLRLFGDNYVAPPRPAPAQKKTKQKVSSFTGCTLAKLAEAKNFPIEHLRSIGWRDVAYGPAPAVAIEYANGTRYRVALEGKDRFRWAKGSKVSLYGLDQLEEIRRGGWVLFVEGETDVAAGKLMGLPVIGVPGVSTWKDGWACQFQGCRVYAWKEPDQAGETFIEQLGEAFWDIQIIEAPAGIKDLCELHDQAGDGAREFFDELRAEAKHWRQNSLPQQGSTTLNPNLLQGTRPRKGSPRESYPEVLTAPSPCLDDNASFETFAEGALALSCAKFGFVLKSYLDDLKDKLLEFLKETGDGERYERAAHCWEFYRELVCQTTERSYLARFHCGERGCSLCAIWAIQQFFEKKELVLAKLEKPAVYRVILGSLKIGPFPQDKQRQIKELYTRIRGMLTHLTDNGIAKDLLYGIRGRIQGEIFSVEVDLLAPYTRELESQLQEHFSREAGVRTYVQRIPVDDRREAQKAMANLMAVPIVWESTEDYEVWRKATKGMKLIQGKGMFYKVAGGAAKNKPPEAGVSSCPICRKCTPVVKPGFHHVEDVTAREVLSELTGELYLERVVNSPPS